MQTCPPDPSTLQRNESTWNAVHEIRKLYANAFGVVVSFFLYVCIFGFRVTRTEDYVPEGSSQMCIWNSTRHDRAGRNQCDVCLFGFDQMIIHLRKVEERMKS
jgi:hypothetical protein